MQQTAILMHSLGAVVLVILAAWIIWRELRHRRKKWRDLTSSQFPLTESEL
jgi:ABC-type nickel/cobalt efflux system permease component RcnA